MAAFQIRELIYNRDSRDNSFEPVTDFENKYRIIDQWEALFKSRKAALDLTYKALVRDRPFHPLSETFVMDSNIIGVIEHNDRELDVIRGMLNGAIALRKHTSPASHSSVTVNADTNRTLVALVSEINGKLIALHKALVGAENQFTEAFHEIQLIKNPLECNTAKDRARVTNLSLALSNANMEVENMSKLTFIPSLFLDDLRLRNSALLSKFRYFDLKGAFDRSEEKCKQIENSFVQKLRSERLEIDKGTTEILKQLRTNDDKIKKQIARMKDQDDEIEKLKEEHRTILANQEKCAILVSQVNFLMAQESSRSGLDIQTRIKSTATNTLQSSDSTAIPTHTSSINVTEPASTYRSSSSNTTRKRSRDDELPEAHFDEDPVRVANDESRLQKAINNYMTDIPPPVLLVLPTLDPKKGKRNHKKYKNYSYETVAKKGKEWLINKHVMRKVGDLYYEGTIIEFSIGIYDSYLIDYDDNDKETLDLDEVLNILID